MSIFVTWDEKTEFSSGLPPIGMIMLSPFAKPNYTNMIAYNHSSNLKTMQEIFQDAAQNAYKVFGRSPMVFLDRQHYCDDTGLYPALLRQAGRLGFADLLSVADEPAEILARFPAQASPLDASDTPRRVLMRMRNLR